MTSEQETARQFFTAMVLGTVVARDGSAFDAWETQRAHIGLGLSAGFVLLVACCYPGDGLRVQEFVAGIVLITASLVQIKTLTQLRVEAMGSALGQTIAAHTVKENIEILNMAAKVLPVTMKHINPTAEEKGPVDIVTQIAESTSAKPKMATERAELEKSAPPTNGSHLNRAERRRRR